MRKMRNTSNKTFDLQFRAEAVALVDRSDRPIEGDPLQVVQREDGKEGRQVAVDHFDRHR